jgi:hypothetical protein
LPVGPVDRQGPRSGLPQGNGDRRESNLQKDAANAALAEANSRVQARFELARRAIRAFKSGVEQDETLKNDSLKPLRDKLLGSARQFYDKLGELLQGQADSVSKAILAGGLRRLALVKLAVWDCAGASADARRAVGLFEGLPSRQGPTLIRPGLRPGDTLGRRGVRPGRPGDGRPPPGRRDRLPRSR